MKKRLKITFNAPLVLTLVAVSFLAMLLNEVTDGVSQKLMFMTYHSSLRSPLTWVRAFTHIFGHSGWSHLIGNMTYLLLLGPMLEEKYSSRTLAEAVTITAFATSLINYVFFPNVALCGASGIVFLFMLLASFTGFREGEIPATFLLVAIFFLGQQIVEGLTVQDNISNMAHIVGGVIGSILGYTLNKKKKSPPKAYAAGAEAQPGQSRAAGHSRRSKACLLPGLPGTPTTGAEKGTRSRRQSERKKTGIFQISKRKRSENSRDPKRKGSEISRKPQPQKPDSVRKARKTKPGIFRIFCRKKRLVTAVAALAILVVSAVTGANWRYAQTDSSAGTSTDTAAGTAAGETSVQLDDIPEYSGNAWVEINDNIPFFEESEMNTETFESYSELDVLGRCGVAYANISRELMPTEERGEIGSVKPSGWVQAKYEGVIDSEPAYLYNRCHLIAYCLTAENANEKNLITGTRYLNIEGMLPFENQVANYLDEKDNHVLYRVTPLFEGDNLVVNGVLMEAYSVEDSGAGICFCVYCYNVQPGIVIDYSTGESCLAE